jgi:tRNA-binding protein
MIDIKDFAKVEIRVGTVISASKLQEAKKPAYKLEIDFGELGIRKSSAQITELYSESALIGKQIVAVMNFSQKKIAGFTSEVLVLGVNNKDEAVELLVPDQKIPDGAKVS